MTVTESPSRIAHYEIESQLGRGAIGTVYAARDTRIGRRVALKTIQIPERHFEDTTAADEFFKRLQREAEVGGALLHPNIVTLYEVVYEGGRVSLLAMELIEGQTLLDIMMSHRPRPVPAELALRIAAGVLRGLSHAHGKGITHRDIKPANILLADDGTVKIADFGIARPDRSSMTVAGSLLGTPNYMSPEQVTGSDVSPRADLFSLGVVLYEMLTATKPFAADDITGILHNILRRDPAHVSTVNRAVPVPVGDLVAAMMKKPAGERPSSDEALAQVNALLRPKVPVRRVVGPTLAAVVIAAAVAAAAIPVGIIASRIDATPTVIIPAEKIAEFEEKRRALEAADALFNEGNYEASLTSYQDYLGKHPHSLAAEEGRDRAAAAIDAQSQPAPSRRTRRSAKDEDISPRELLGRIRRVFKR